MAKCKALTESVLKGLTNLESQNDGPYKAECQSRIAINYVVCSHVLQVNSHFIQKSE